MTTIALATVLCPRCRVDVLADKVAAPDRCLDPACPLKSKS